MKKPCALWTWGTACLVSLTGCTVHAPKRFPDQEDAVVDSCVEGLTSCAGNVFMRCVGGELVAEEGCLETCHPVYGCDSQIPPDELRCSVNPQAILIIDFRSGWWAGGGGGGFYEIILEKIFNTCPNISIEYLHFEIGLLVKCVYESSLSPDCSMLATEISENMTYEELLAFFDKESWDDYTQLWILSGSDQDPLDINITSNFFTHVIAETTHSCIPIFLGAGDGFITHGNALGTELGIGDILTSDLAEPGFFSVATGINDGVQDITVISRMNAGVELQDNVLFTDVTSIADQVTNSGYGQTAHGDSLIENDSYTIIAHDTDGRPAIGIGEIPTDIADEPRPIIFDAGLQRFYGIAQDDGTQTYLENIVMYLGSVGCKAVVY